MNYCHQISELLEIRGSSEPPPLQKNPSYRPCIYVRIRAAKVSHRECG